MPPLTEEEVSELYKDLKDRIFRYILTLSGNESVAEDLTQEVFIRVHQSRELYRGTTENFLSWARVIARNTYYNHHRKEKRVKEEDPSILETVQDTKIESAESRIEKKFLKKTILEAISCLPEPEKSVLIYREILGKTLEETAGKLGFSVRTLSRKVIKAMELLRVELEKRGISHPESTE